MKYRINISNLHVHFPVSLFSILQWRRRSQRPSVVLLVEHLLDLVLTLLYVLTTLGTVLCSCMMESSSLAVRVRFPVSFLGNRIGGEGASALAESLKQNTTLTEMNLEGMSSRL